MRKGLGFTKTEEFVIGSSFILMGLLGVLFNIFTLFVLTLGKNISKKVKIQLINLAIADLLLAILRTPSAVLGPLTISFPESPTLCRFHAISTIMVAPSTLYCNAAIAIERFIIIYFPLRALRYTTAHKCVIVAVIWFITLTLGFLVSFDVTIKDLGIKKMCTLDPTNGILLIRERMVLYGVVFILPTVVIVTFYTLVFAKLYCRKSSSIRHHESTRQQHDQNKVQ